VLPGSWGSRWGARHGVHPPGTPLCWGMLRPPTQMDAPAVKKTWATSSSALTEFFQLCFESNNDVIDSVCYSKD